MDYEKERINGLTQRLQNGDKSAFDEFYKLTSPKAYFIALKITQNEHDAEDILQESYIKALEKLNEIDVSQNVMSWFCRIVANKSKDLLKSRKPLVFEDKDENFFEEIPEDKTEFCPEENLNQEELRLEVMAAIDELTDEKRACIMMMYFGEMSVKEIAESIEVPESTVKNRLYTARKDLKNKFEKSGNVIFGAALGGVLIWALQKTSVTASAAFAASAASANILAGIGASAAYSAVTTASASAAVATTATASGATTAAATTAAAATSTAATTAAATATGIGAKVAALSVVQKVVVGVAATAVIGGGSAGVATVVKTVTNDPEPTTLAEEVTTSPFVTSEDAFNEIVATTAPTTQETSTTDVSSTQTSATALTERSTKPVTTAKPTTTKAHTTQKPMTTQRETTTKQETTTRTETTTQRVTTTVPTTRPTTVPTTVPTTQAAATMTVDIIDMDGSVIETLSFSVPAGTTLTKAYIIDSVRTKNYEPMAGVYGSDVGTVAQSGQTYHFEAEL